MDHGPIMRSNWGAPLKHFIRLSHGIKTRPSSKIETYDELFNMAP